MATRKSEWLASIKPILDREEVKNDAKALAKELSDILEFKVTDADSLEQLTKEFNKQLVNMGKQQIVFSEKTLQGIVSQFANAIAEGITKGVNDIGHINADPLGKKIGDRIGEGIAGGIIDGVSDGLKDASNNLEAEFDQLIQKQEKKIKEFEKLQSKIRRKEDVGNKLELDPYVKGSVKVDDHFAEYAANIIDEQDEVNDQLEQAIDSGNVTEKLLKEWVKTTQKYRDIYRTVNSMDKDYAKKLLGSDYKYFTDAAYESKTQVGFDTIEEFIDTDELQDNIDTVEKELQDLQIKIDNILRERPEFISKKEALEAAERLQQIQQAYEKLNKTQTGRKSIEKIESALSHKGAGAEVTAMPENPTLGVYDDGYGEAQKKYNDQLKKHAETYERAKKALESAFQAYDNSAGKSWDERYRLLIKAAEEFESIENNPNISNKDKEDVLGGYRETFEQEIKPIKDIARGMLQDIINLRDGKDLVSTRIPSKEDNVAPDVEDVSNAQKLTEETADKADEEKRAREEAEKKRLADEASASANHDAADAAERERLAKEASASADSSVETKEPIGAVGSDVDTKDGNDVRNNIQTILKDADEFLASNKDKKIKDYFELIATDAYKMSDDVKTAIEETIGSIDSLQSINIGANNQGGLIGDKSALILRKPHFDRDKQKWSTDEPNDNAISLQSRLNNANIHDINLGKIQEVIKAEEYLVELQNRVSGTPISTIGEAIEDINPDVLNATEASIQSLIQAMHELYNIGVEVDVENLGNILYDGKSDRFGIVDMDVKHDFESFEDMLSAFAQSVRNQVEDISDILNNPNMAQSWSRFADMIDGEVEKAKLQLSTPDVIEGRTDNQSDEQYKRVKQETSAHQENTDAIKNETKAQEELNNVKSQTANIDDDSETIAKENGALEDKLELLRDIADQYAANITQKQRDRYEELNQKDMDTGLSDKEDERYYELGEQIDAADSALEEFGQTYDKIILKLENGKKVDILPDDKGLRSLYKFADEYGETYGGVEIEDVIFERVKQEANAHQENTTAIKNETKAQEELNDVNIQAADDNNSKKIQSYEELNSILKEYLDLEKQKKKFEHIDEDWEWDSISDRYSSLNSLEQTKDDFDTQWKRVLNIKNAIKNGYDSYLDPETKSSERLQENTLEEETKRLKAIALAYADNTEANLDLLNKTQRKFVDDVVNARNVWQEDFESRKIPYNEHNDPIEKRQYEIESIIIDSTSLDNMTGILDSFNQAKSIGQFDSDAVETFAKYLGIELPQAAQTAGKAIDGLNNNLEETRNTAKMPDTQIGTGDASSADVDVAKAEAEKQRLEKERIEAEKIAIQQENEAKLKAEADAKAKLQADLAVANQQLTDAQEAKALADANTQKVEDESRVKDGVIQGLREQLAQVQSGESGAKASISVEELKNVLSAITYNVKVVQDTDSADSKVAIDEAELKSVLNSITYNVKITHDDADKTANKITLDESALESTLKRVFANILGPNVEQDSAEPNNAPWALESTLNGVIKETLAQIQTNTAKTESIEVAPAKTDVGNVLATENTLAAIKTAVEAINTKVVKGTKAQTSDGSSKKTGVDNKNAESYAGSQYFPEKLKTQTMYLAKFRAQLMSTGKLTDDIDAQIYQLLDGLKQVKNGPDFSKWNQQFLQLKTSVGITDIFEGAVDKEVTASYKEIIEFQKIRNKLELQYTKAQEGSYLKQFYAEQLAQMDQVIANQQIMLDNEEYEIKLGKMRAEQARKLEEAENKARDKDAKKQAANDKQMAKKKAMVGKAGNAIGRAENVWLGAQDTDSPLPPSLNKQIDNLYEKLVALREMQNEVNQAPTATEEQQKKLREQTIEVNSLTNEVGELLSEYQKLSGANVDPEKIRITTLTEKSGVDEYRQQMKQYVSEITHGQGQIKNFDAATKTLTYTVKTGKNEFTEYTVAVRRADNAMVSVQGTTKRTETFFEATARKMKELTSYFSGMAIMSRAMQELRRGVQYVKEIDLALTELKKVTDETEQTYDRFLQTAAKTADRVGSTIKDIVSSTADWARLGYTIKEAAQLAESTQILMNVSEFTDVSQATDTLISAVQAFGYTAETSMEVVDLLNTIGNNYAISTADLAQSLTKSSASLVAAGGDLAEAAALTATANAIIQDADSVGTALKTTSLRLRGTDSKLLDEEGLDSEGAITSKSKLQSKVKALSGVDILTATGEYKSTYEILSQIANVWSDINDMDQAALLELISGKRNSSVIAAILQSPEALKAAYEDAQNAEGSALKENEKYLDSIQGKIDQFNNAMQAMWSNALDSDVVKWFVALGTEIIKIIDKLGLLKSALLAFGAYKGFSVIFKSLKDSGITIKSVLAGVNSLTVGFKQNAIAQTAANGATAASTVANKLFRNSLVESLATQYLTTQSTQALEAAKYSLKLAEMGLMNGIATTKDVQAAQAAVEAASIPVDISKIGTTELMGLAFKQLALSIWGAVKAIGSFLLTNPVGWIILAIGAIAGGVAIFNHFHKTTEELTEELNELKSELRDIQSELDSVNTELKTTEERMSELLAKDSLSFTEKEELDNLKKQNDELQRRIDLLALEKKQKSKQAASTFVDLMEKDVGLDFWSKGSTWENGVQKPVEYVTVFDSDGNEKYTGKDNSWGAFWNELWYEAFDGGSRKFLSETEYLDKQISDYQNATDEKKQEIEATINNKFDEWKAAADGLEYGIDPETDKWLDFIYNYQDKWAIASGGTNAKTNAIARIFNKDNNAEISDSIDAYVEALKNGDTSAKSSIENIIKNNADLVEDIEASGLSLNDAVDYFTSFASEANYATIDGKVSEIAEASDRLSKALSGNFDPSNFKDLEQIKQMLSDKGWVDVDGELLSDAIAEYFGGENGGISDETRKEIERLVKQIYDGKITIQDALKSFELFGVQSVVDIQIKDVQTNFKDVFVDLEDADGLIDTFKELGDAIGSTVGALEAFNQAQADVADKGFVSIQTALKLMEYTDDYGSVLQVVDGKLQLAENAEQNLIQTRIDAIKVSAQTAVADAQAAYDKAELAVQSYRSAMVEETSASTVATAWQKIVAAAAGIKNALDNIWSGESLSDLYNSGYNTYLESATGYKTTYDDSGLQALEDALSDAKKKLNEAKGNAEIANALTADNLQDIYNPSDKDTIDEVEDDLFQREMDYWENQLSANQAKRDQIQNEIDLLESQGKRAGEEYYRELIVLEKERKAMLEAQKAEALKYLSVQEEGSEEWWDAAKIVNDLEGEIDDATAALQDYADVQAQIKWDNLEEITKRFSDLHDEISDLRDILQREDMFDDNGNWTESGAAVLGTYVQDLEMYKNELATLQGEIADLQAHPYNAQNAAYLKEKYSIDSEQEYNDLMTQWNQQQREYVKSAYDTADAIRDAYEQQVDAIEDAVGKQIDAYNDYIDVVKSALDAERD